MRGMHFVLVCLAISIVATPAYSRDLSYLKSKPFDLLTSAELSAAKEEAKKLKVPRLVACADPGNMPLSNDKNSGKLGIAPADASRIVIHPGA